MSRRARLREGFTTGTAAAAAAKAATLLLTGAEVPSMLDVPLPPGGRLAVPLAACGLRPDGAAYAEVVKDGGDDPDATHGATIRAIVRLLPEGSGLVIEGGAGVGRVTLPGLPVAVGEAAINPAPRGQIAAAAREALAGRGVGLSITIEVDDGAAIAARTLNPRLGIVGGISILGTRGTVKPFSHEAWIATVESGLDVARAQGLTRVFFATGGRSENALRALFPDAPETAFVQAADYFADSLRAAARRGFRQAVWGVFFGKLVKQAKGLSSTHARSAPLDLGWLAARLGEAGVEEAACAAVARANTAMQALAILERDPAREHAIHALALLAREAAQSFAGPDMAVGYRVFDFEGGLAASLD